MIKFMHYEHRREDTMVIHFLFGSFKTFESRTGFNSNNEKKHSVESRNAKQHFSEFPMCPFRHHIIGVILEATFTLVLIINYEFIIKAYETRTAFKNIHDKYSVSLEQWKEKIIFLIVGGSCLLIFWLPRLPK